MHSFVLFFSAGVVFYPEVCVVGLCESFSSPFPSFTGSSSLGVSVSFNVFVTCFFPVNFLFSSFFIFFLFQSFSKPFLRVDYQLLIVARSALLFVLSSSSSSLCKGEQQHKEMRREEEMTFSAKL